MLSTQHAQLPHAISHPAALSSTKAGQELRQILHRYRTGGDVVWAIIGRGVHKTRPSSLRTPPPPDLLPKITNKYGKAKPHFTSPFHFTFFTFCTKSHCREFCDELRRDVREVRQYLLGPFPHGGLVVMHVVLLAEGLHEGVHLKKTKPNKKGQRTEAS